MTDTIKISRELAEQICVELEHDNDRYMLGRELRKALATPPADAADMGGQAGEEVEVVAWLSEVRSGNKTVIRASMSETSLEGMRRGYRDENAVIVRDDPCMTVAQHRCILAQHRQQAGKLVEALRQVRGYADSPRVVGVIAEALADWEKTNA